MKKILVTGAAGFIGSKVAEKFLDKGYFVVGIDNLNDYYDVKLKNHRLDNLGKSDFQFYKSDIQDYQALTLLFKSHNFESVINLAARAGVRYSLENPFVYESTNSLGTLNLLECCRNSGVDKFVLASTSSLYAGQAMPFKEDLPVNQPISPYAASKKGAEAMSYAYHFLYDTDVTVLRFFTVYGPAGRPDMSVFRFIKWIDEGTPIELFGDGSQSRDFTFIDDIAEGVIKAAETFTGYEIINLGGNKPYELNQVIKLIEKELNKPARRKLMPFHKADLKATWADISKARRILNWKPEIPLEEGIKRSVAWYFENKSWLKEIKL